MRKLLFLPLIGFIFLLGCNEENQDAETEVSCSTATGTWSASAVTCNATAVSSFDPLAITFASSSSITQEQGGSACATTSTWDVSFGSFEPTVDLTGNGNLSCNASGSSVASCVDGSNSCNSSTSITGFVNNYTTCVISNGQMQISRTVSATNNPNNNSYCNDGEEEVITLTQASGGGSSQAVLDITGADPASFTSTSVGSSSQLNLTLSNSGGASATSIAGSGLASPFQFLGGSYPGTGGTCAATLAAGASCTIVVNFSPSSAGASNDTLIINYNDGASAQILNHGLTGTGVGGSVALLVISETDPYDFGPTQVGFTSSHNFTVTNTGSGTATSIFESGLAAPFSFVGGSYPGTGGTCGAVISAGSNCVLNIRFAPTVTGLAADSISLGYNDGSSAQTATRDVQGTGTP